MNNQSGDFAVKERITFLEALGEMSPKVKQALENVTISVGSNGSGFRLTANTLYVGKNASKYEIIREIGHAIEDKLFDKDKVNFMKEQCVKGLTAKDIVEKVGVDSSGNQTKVLVINPHELIDKYQGNLKKLIGNCNASQVASTLHLYNKGGRKVLVRLTQRRKSEQQLFLCSDTTNAPMPKIKYYPKCGQAQMEISAALKSICVDSSFTFQSKIAVKNGITNHKGTIEQNTKMLELFKKGNLAKFNY